MKGSTMLASFAIIATCASPMLHARTAPNQAGASQPPAAAKPYKPDFEIPKTEPPVVAPPRQSTAAAGEQYVIGAQDNLAIIVTDETDLTGKYRVDTDGTISMPYLNRVPVAGLSLAEAQVKITQMLQAGYLKNPQVRIEVDQFKSRRVMVSGEVRTPGFVAMAGTAMTLLEALALAGSPTQNASNEVIVVHPVKPGDKPADPITVNRRDLELGKADVALQDGDIINVPVAKRFFISGFVKNPGSYVLDSGMTVSQAIVLAGGLNDRGSDRRIKVSRVVNGRTIELSVELDDRVQPSDEIKIPSRFF